MRRLLKKLMNFRKMKDQNKLRFIINQLGKAIGKTKKFLKAKGLLAVLFDKGVGFCIMRKENV